MTRDDIQKLLGGYATGTLTAEEQQALFEAALQDQDLFDALAREQALREVLEEPAARAQLLAALDDAPAPWYRGWWRAVPAAVLATAFAVLAIITLRPNLQTVRHLPVAKLPPAPVASVPVLPPPPAILPPAPSGNAPLLLPGYVPPVAPPPPPAQVAVLTKKDTVAISAQAPAIDMPKPQEARGPLSMEPRLPGAIQPGSSFPFGNSFVPQSSVDVHGVVSDPIGAPVAAANVEVKSLDTGAVEKVTTDEHGQFAVQELPGRRYEIKASAPGLQTATVNTVSGAALVDVRLAAGPASTSVAATVMPVPAAGAPAGGGGGGRGGRGGFAAASASPPAVPAARQQTVSGVLGGVVGKTTVPALGLQYRVMRRLPAGDLSEVGVGVAVNTADELVLEITPNSDGYVRVSRADGSAIVTQAVRATERFYADLPKFSIPERVELRVTLSRTPFVTPPSAAATGALASPESFQVTVTLNVR